MSDSRTAEPAEPGTPLLEGSFAEYPFDNLLEMVGISRQCFEIVTSEQGTPRGALLIKSSQLLSARAGGQEGLPAFHALRAQPGDRFAMFPRPAIRWPAVTLGPLSQVMAAPPPASDSQLVMQGLLGPVTLIELLEIAAISRQQLEIAIANASGRIGSMVVRAGYLLSASERGGPEGIEAFNRLMRVSGEHFLVLRQATDLSAVPLATIAELIDTDEDTETGLALIMKGDLSEISITDVLGAFSLSRQLIELVLTDDSGIRGTILIKSGHLLSARSMAHGSQGKAAFIALLREPGTDVTAHAREQSVRDLRQIGKLTDLIAAASQPESVPAPVRAPLMEGNFSTMSFQALLMMISRGRQVMEVVLHGDDAERGTLKLKSGQLLSATAGSLSGAEAFQALHSDPGARFQVYRIAPEQAPSTPIGPLQQLISRPAPIPPPLRRDVVLKGSIEDGSVSDIFQIVGISRMHLELEFHSGDTRLGEMTVKAGQVLTARAGDLTGQAAVHEILSAPHAEVIVYQSPPPSPLPASIGTLADFLHSHDLPAAPSPAAAPAPAPTPDPALAAALAQLQALQARLDAQNILIESLSSQQPAPAPAPAPAQAPAPPPEPQASPELLSLLQAMQQPAQSERMLMWLVGSSQVVMLILLGVLALRFIG